jgi:hypothetical protein
MSGSTASRPTTTIDDRAERPVWNHDQLIRRNLILLNHDAQVWGWFDTKDNRHWPASSASTNQTGAAVTAKPGDIPGAYAAKTSQGQPQGLTLNTSHRSGPTCPEV